MRVARRAMRRWAEEVADISIWFVESELLYGGHENAAAIGGRISAGEESGGIVFREI